VQHERTPKGTPAEGPIESVPGRAQIPTAPYIDADVEAICELRNRIRHLWANLTAPSREGLSVRLDLLGTAADHRDTNSMPVRQALQEVLISVGTGALGTLSETTRQRLTALTGIALPDHLPPTGQQRAAADTGHLSPESRG